MHRRHPRRIVKQVFLSADSFARAHNSESVKSILAEAGFDVVETGSYGAAWLEPLVEFNTDTTGRIGFGPVSESDIRRILGRFSNGQDVSDDVSYLGIVADLEFLSIQRRLVFNRIGLHPPLERADFNGVEQLLHTPATQIIQNIETSGLRGRGGAGFPAHIKWRTVNDSPSAEKYIVCNADEGDSGTFADRLLMEGDPFRLIEGMVIAGHAVGAGKGYIYLRSEYPLAYSVMESALVLARERGLLGERLFGTDFCFDIDLFLGAGAYICGEETSLLESLEGKRGQIKVKPPVPAIAGLFEKPTLVHNVITLAAVPGIFEVGAEAYREIGQQPSCGTMTFQLAGNVKHGGLIEMPFGCTLRYLIEDVGGGTYSGKPLKAVQIGGPLGAYLSHSQLDTPLTYEHMAEIGAGIGHGGIVVFDNSIDLVEQAEYAFEFCEIESCGKCTPCRIGSVRGKELIQEIKRDGYTDDRARLVQDLCAVMEKASLCQMGGMTPIPVRSAISNFASDFERRRVI